jgi:hypothetical protein
MIETDGVTAAVTSTVPFNAPTVKRSSAFMADAQSVDRSRGEALSNCNQPNYSKNCVRDNLAQTRQTGTLPDKPSPANFLASGMRELETLARPAELGLREPKAKQTQETAGQAKSRSANGAERSDLGGVQRPPAT